MTSDNVERVEAIRDPAERLRAATDGIATAQRDLVELGRIRKSLIDELRQQGMSFSQIGELAGLTRGRIHQILQAGPPTESRFFGHSPITVALPLRYLPGRPEEPVISSEDERAYEMLSGFLLELAFDVTRFLIPVGEPWNTSTASTVAICGPKSSATIAEAIARDPVLAFEPDPEDRWVIRHRLTSEVYLSPIDTGARTRTRDIAYVGRITTGKQRLLIIAGVHSLGSVGAVHYIQHNLHDLYRQTGLNDFSMVVASQHQGTQVIESSALCPPTLH
jgi:transcriptional regulator with XRE-family HTH domain